MAKKNASNKKAKETKKVVEKVEVKEQQKEVKEQKKDKKKKTNIGNIIKENMYMITLCIICLLLIVNIVLITIGHKVELKDGKEVIATIKGKKYVAEEIYEDLKENYGITSLINIIDNYIVDKEITDNKEATEYAEEQVATLKQQYESYDYDWNETLTSYGYSSEKDLINEIMANYKKELVVKKYLEKDITEEEIEKYYNEEIFGNYTAKHILITPDKTDEMTDDEVKAAEDAAKAKAEEVINKLNSGEQWTTLVNEYSEDEGSKENEGLIEDFTKGDVVEEFFDAVLKLEDGKYTSEPVKSTYGYHVILKVSNTEKQKLKDVKEKIIDELVNEKLTSDEKLYNSTWDEVRKAYKLSIKDTTLEKAYNKTIEG